MPVNSSSAALDGAKIEQITALNGKWTECGESFRVTAAFGETVNFDNGYTGLQAWPS
jgi:hypothetical protein